jgi:hypothetical protein
MKSCYYNFSIYLFFTGPPEIQVPLSGWLLVDVARQLGRNYIYCRILFISVLANHISVLAEACCIELVFPGQHWFSLSACDLYGVRHFHAVSGEKMKWVYVVNLISSMLFAEVNPISSMLFRGSRIWRYPKQNLQVQPQAGQILIYFMKESAAHSVPIWHSCFTLCISQLHKLG